MEIRSIEIWSAAKVLGATYALIGLIVGVLSTIAVLIGGGGNEGYMAAGGVVGTFLIIIVYGIGGFDRRRSHRGLLQYSRQRGRGHKDPDALALTTKPRKNPEES